MQYTGQQRKQQMACLYTKQKTQKRKKWHDGRLVLHSMGASLYDAHPPPGSGDPKLDECCLSRAQCDALQRQAETRLETDKYLVQVEGPWIVSTAPISMAKPNSLVSQGMKKVITKKFRKPGTFVPLQMQEQQNQGMRKRQRHPLQPGDLQRRYYGNNAPPQQQQQQQLGPPPSSAPLPAWNQAQQRNHQGTTAGPVNFQGQQQYPPQQQQMQMASGSYNPSPQPPFQQQHGQQQQQQQRVTPPFQQGQQPPPAPTQQGQPHMTPNGYNSLSDYSTPNPAPMQQASLSQQQRVQPASRPTETNTNAFVGNKFNPNNFYGEDEEEECSQEEEDGGFGGWNMQPQQPFWNPSPNLPASAAVSAGPTRNGNDITPVTSQPEQNSTKQTDSACPPVPPQQQTTCSRTGNSSALSKDELLKLFGASPYVAETVQQTEETNETTGDTQPTQQEPPMYELVLPPPDAPSDDDSSVESDDDEVTK